MKELLHQHSKLIHEHTVLLMYIYIYTCLDFMCLSSPHMYSGVVLPLVVFFVVGGRLVT